MVVKEGNKKTTIIVMIALIITGIVFGYFTITSRFKDNDKSDDYLAADGEIIDVEKYRHQGSENDYYTYTAEITCVIDGEERVVSTPDEVKKKLKVGRNVIVLYKEGMPEDYYIAQKDWLTGKYLTLGSQNDMLLFMSIFFLTCGMLLTGMRLKKGMAQSLVICCPLMILGIFGAWVGIANRVYPLLLLLVFTAFGALSLFTDIFAPKKQRDAEDENLVNSITVFVTQVYADSVTYHKNIIMEVYGENPMYFYYRADQTSDIENGNVFTLDKRKIAGANTVEIDGKHMPDISFLRREDFGEVDETAAKLVQTVLKINPGARR